MPNGSTSLLHLVRPLGKCTTLVYCGATADWEGCLMDGMKRQKVRRMPTSHRASVSFPAELYETLEGIARQKRVSMAWVVREAAERYVAEQWPLFATEKREWYEPHG